MKTFQTLFPPLSPQTLSLSSARRVVLISYSAEKGTIEFRHYLITVKPYGVSKRIRRVLDGASAKATSSSKAYLDLGDEKDVADFFLRRKGEPGPGASDGYESAASSASSMAGDDADAVSLADDYVGRNNKKGQKRAVKLDEIGPRMELRLIKISEGLPGKEGSVIYHEFGMSASPFIVGDYVRLNIWFRAVKKTKAEVAAQKAEHTAKEKLRKARREEQEWNVKRKKMEKGKGKTKGNDDEQEEPEGSDETEGEGDHYEEGVWDDDEEISEEEADDEFEGSAGESESEEEAAKPLMKRPKTHDKR